MKQDNGIMKRAAFLFVLFSLLIGGSVLAQATEPALSDLGWNEIPVPTGICARGTPYSFFVHPGNPDKLMIYFEGGGSCWDADTCKVGGPFADSVSSNEVSSYLGMFNFDNSLNPVADYSVVFVSYCTGDVHTGSGTQTYTVGGTSFTIHFNGFNNARAVLAWTYANYPNPSDLIITGSSAGSYGAIFHAPHVLSHYPDAHATVFGDAGVGASAGGFNGPSAWNTSGNVYQGAGYNPSTTVGDLTGSLWAAAATAFPKVNFGEYSAHNDVVQTGFYTLEGGSSEDWVVGMQNVLTNLDQLSNFHSYIAWGSIHTILPRPLFYAIQVNGTSFRSWFSNLIGDQPISNVECSDCQTPELVKVQ